MIVRMIEPTDLSEIIELRGRTRENPFSRKDLLKIGIIEESVTEMLRTTHRGWLCEENEKIAGFAIGDGKTGELWVIAVLPEFECRGIGSLLMAAVEGWLAEIGWQEFWLWTSSDSKKQAFSFYMKHGWIVSESGADTVCMKKKRPSQSL